MKEVDYKFWANYLLDVVSENLDTYFPSALELGAGNCKMADIISGRYANYIASDLSSAMLKLNNKKSIKKICCDMTFLPFKTKFDLIFSAFDSVNYLMTKKQLLKLFTEIRNLLSEEGIFTFDVSLEKNSLEFTNTYKIEAEANGYRFKRKSKYNPSTRIHKNTFKIIDKNGYIRKEIHKQKIFKFHTYFKLIEEAGLFVVQCLDAFTFNNANANCDRVQFILKVDRSKC